MSNRARIIKAAFPKTIPVLTGYLFLGTAYGIYMNGMGLPPWFPTIISIFVFAGSMQFVLVNLLVGAFAPLNVLFLTLMVNARHLFYGISMLDRYHARGWRKWYMIFGLTDETFSVNVACEPPEGVDRDQFMFWITLMDHCYWVLGATIGGMLGSVLHFNTHGIDFVMTALFVVIYLEQWLNHPHHKPALIGLGASALCLLVFGADNFILPAMGLILLLLMVFQRPLDREELGG